MPMKILGIIPARFDSSRFPGKPLVDIAGKSMIRRVYEQAIQSSSLSKVVIATDDQRIFEHVKDFGAEVITTSNKHLSGTDRCGEVALHYPEFDILVNIQGDEPLIDPRQIDLLCSCFENTDTSIATLVKKIKSAEELFNENTPKVVPNNKLEAIYFSRSPIPFQRGLSTEQWLDSYSFYKHIGIYAFRNAILSEITQLPVSSLEKAEALEQLRWIENGYKIKVAITELESQAIDTPEDLQKILDIISHEAS